MARQLLVLCLAQVLSSRGDFATAPDGDMIPNIVHGSDSDESAAREIKIWFGE